MEFANHNDLDLIIKMEHHGRPIRVADCVRFAVKVWSQNPNNFLLFTSRDVIKDDRADRLVIPGYQMAALESGVIVYEYSYSLNDRHFKPFEGHHHQDHTKRVVTDIYWKNCNFNQVPSNPINYQSLNHLRSLIEQEVTDRENAIIDLRDYFNESFIDGLRDEIARSTAKDDELKALIDENKKIADGCVDALLEKIEGEIKRSNEVDIELFNELKKAGTNTTEIKEETDQKIEETNNDLADEVERAKGAEKELNDAITAEADRAKKAETNLNAKVDEEISRAKVKEAEIDSVISAEVARAKVVEGALSDGLDAQRDRANQIASDLAAEVSRSNQKDNEHTAALNDETTRAKAAEKAIVDRLDVIEGDKDVVGSIAHSLEDAKHYVDDLIGKVTTDELKDLATVNAALDAEISRATTKETELQNALDTLNGDKETNGSVANAVEGAKKYADEAIATTLSNHNTDLTNLTNDLNTEVSRATAAEKALGDRLDVAETNLSNTADAILNLTTADNDLSNALATEVSRATTKEAEITAALAVVNGDEETIGSIKHALDDSKHYTDNKIANAKTQNAADLADAIKDFATKAEVDTRVEGIIGTAPAALDTLGEIADRLSEDSDALNAINAVLTGKANAADVYTKAEADAKHTAITNDLATANTAITNEVTRAKAAEKVNADAITSLTATVNGVKATADTATADLAAEVSRAQSAESTLTDSVNSVDVKADQNAANIATLQSDMTTAKSDISGLSDALNSEVSRAQTAEGVIDAKVDALDSKVDGIKTTADKAAADLVDEIARAKAAENTLSNDLATLTSDLSAEVSRATVKEGELESGVSANATAIGSLATRTSAVETALATSASDITALKNAMDVVNGDENTIGSVAHAEADAKHYTDDEIAKVNTKIDAEVVGFATKSEVAGVDARVDALTTKVNNIETVDAYSKSEVDQMIEDIDVTDQLVDYAKTAETTVIKDSDGNIITEMVIDNGDDDDTIEVYTRAQCDEIFAKKGEVSGGADVDLSNYATKAELQTVQNSIPQIVTLTQAQYDALTSYTPNTLYIVNG